MGQRSIDDGVWICAAVVLGTVFLVGFAAGALIF